MIPKFERKHNNSIEIEDSGEYYQLVKSREHLGTAGYMQEIDGTKNKRELIPIVPETIEGIAGLTTLVAGVAAVYIPFRMGLSPKETVEMFKSIPDGVKYATSEKYREKVLEEENQREQ